MPAKHVLLLPDPCYGLAGRARRPSIIPFPPPLDRLLSLSQSGNACNSSGRLTRTERDPASSFPEWHCRIPRGHDPTNSRGTATKGLPTHFRARCAHPSRIGGAFPSISCPHHRGRTPDNFYRWEAPFRPPNPIHSWRAEHWSSYGPRSGHAEAPELHFSSRWLEWPW